ncbi:MAG: hypothetical protein D6762_08655 [Candidatus Neomarinimicrobiota bacterium]|nr:MAG: hypothetical protein D6762_08655 [Candidatus Neomarinimicrobiota bacterium]
MFETLVSQTSPVTVTIRPFTDWEPDSRYFIRARGERLLALDSTRYQDSLLVVQITTGSAVRYGSLSGAWQSVDSVRVGLHLEAVEKPGKYLEKVVNSWSEFHFTEIPEGAYLLSIFIDRDASQAYTYGSVNPPQPAEYFWYLADTLHIRANWETELSPIVIQEP